MALCGASTQLSKYAALSPCTISSVHRQTPDFCLASTPAALVTSKATGTCRVVRRCLLVNSAGSEFDFEQNVRLQVQLPAALRMIRLRKGRVQTLAISRKGAIIRVEQNSNAADDKVEKPRLGRRKVLELAALVAVASNGVFGASPAHAYKPPPEGFRRYTDRLDGFTLLIPEYWVQVRGSGAEVQFRSPSNGDENLFVAVSSPSSSKYEGVKDLGSPQTSGESIKKQYIGEFMSTRLGVRRTAEVLSASSREVEEGKPYYEIEMSVKSVATTNQLAIRPEERVPFVEWERRYITLQAVENKRLYELRLQVPADRYAQERPLLQLVLDSFRTFPVEGFEGSKPI